MSIIGARIKEGQGLGNRLFIYITLRALAKQKGYDFSVLDSDILENSATFLKLDYGKTVPEDTWIHTYSEKNDRLFIGNSKHDISYGVDVSGTDDCVWNVESGTLLEGIFQSEKYFEKYKDDIRQWLSVKDEYECYEYSLDNLCVINIRGGEYTDSPELYLRRKYWIDAMENMRRIRRDMNFMVVTDDIQAAKRILPEVEAYHFDACKDFVIVKNAKYLVISNSSFAFFPAYVSTTARRIIAPKYWARHNVSDGYWSCEQNIYEGFVYQDRKGNLFTAQECIDELELYKKKSKIYKRLNMPLVGMRKLVATLNAKRIRTLFWIDRALRSGKRRLLRKNA